MLSTITRRCAWCFAMIVASSLHADEPTKPAAKTKDVVFAVGNSRTALAFRVDPLSTGVQQIRGLGQCLLDGETPREVIFEIIGTYRAGHSQKAQGVLLYSQPGLGRTKSITWNGTFDPQQRGFKWSATVAGRSHDLPMVRPYEQSPIDAAAAPAMPVVDPASAPKAAGAEKRPSPTGTKSSPAEVTPGTDEAFARSASSDERKLRASDFFDKDGDLDFGKLLVHGIATAPDPPQSSGPVLGGVIRKRADYPANLPDRIRQSLVKPGSPSAQVVDGNKPLVDEFHTHVVPRVVGLSFENAAIALWSVGLQPSPVECLGHATDPAKADRVVFQSPDAGAVRPLDRAVRLQWYTDEEHPPEPTETAEASNALYRVDGAYRLQNGTHTFATVVDDAGRYDFTLRVQFTTNQGPYDRTSTMQGVPLERSKDHIKIDVKSIVPAGQWGTGTVVFRRNGGGMTMQVNGRTIEYAR